MGIRLSYPRGLVLLFLLPAGHLSYQPLPRLVHRYQQHHRSFLQLRSFLLQGHTNKYLPTTLGDKRNRAFSSSSLSYSTIMSSSTSSPSPLSSKPTKKLPTTLSSTSTSLSSFTSSVSDETTTTSSSVISESHTDYTLEALQQFATRLIETNRNSGSDDNTSKRISVSIVVAGGGGHAISTLASTSGASSLLLEGVVAYDRNSYLKYCNMSDQKGFVFSSHEAARVASVAAMKHALTIRSMDDNVRLMPRCIGVGSASALVSGSSSSTGSGSGGVKGYGHVVATRADGLQLSLNVTLEGRSNDGTEGRSRLEEDVFLSHLILRSIEHLERNCPPFDSSSTSTTTTTTAGDTITESWSNIPKQVDPTSVIEDAARRVVEGGEEAVVLLPLYDTTRSTPDENNVLRPVSFRALSVPVIPNHSIVFPGSFNPPHYGHVALANASVRTLERLQPYVHRRHNDKPVFFELSLMNADKPSIDPATVAKRVQQFLQLGSNDSDKDSDHGQIPQQWGVILTRVPLFAQKLSSLQDCVLNRVGDDDDDGPPNINFVIGTDTLVRILNPKYYNNDKENMVSSLLGMKGAHYIVGGRLEQNKDPSSSSSAGEATFVSGEEELKDLPEELASMFTVMKESEFRVDISSSEIRAKAEAEAAAATAR